MKRVGLIFSLLLAICLIANAQVNPHAIGVRLDEGTRFGAEASYQHGLGDKHRIEIDAGAGWTVTSTRIYLVGAFHWDWNIVHGLNWYVGPAATVGVYTFDTLRDYVNVGVGGQLGFEYDFNKLNVPLLVSIDTRPMWDIPGHASGLWWGAAIAARYTF